MSNRLATLDLLSVLDFLQNLGAMQLGIAAVRSSKDIFS